MRIGKGDCLSILGRGFCLADGAIEPGDLQAGLGGPTNDVEKGYEPGRVLFHHSLEGGLAVIANDFEELNGCELIAGFMDFAGVQIARFLKDVHSSFGLGFDLFDQCLDFEIILVAALFPIGEVLGIESLAGFAQLVDDDRVREAVIEHVIDHVASFFGQARDFAVTAWIG